MVSRLYPAHIFDLKWKLAEVSFIIILTVVAGLFLSAPLSAIGLVLIPFVSVNFTFISYKYSKTREMSFEPSFVPTRLQMFGIIFLWLISSGGLIYLNQEEPILVAFALVGLVFCGLDVARYLAFSRAYRIEVTFHEDEYSIAALEWEESSRAFQLANHYHLNNRHLSAAVWWMFAVGRYRRVLRELIDGGKTDSDPEYIAAEHYMRAGKLALRSEIVRFFSIENSRKIFTQATDEIGDAMTHLSLFRCDICEEIHHRRDLIRLLNIDGIAETEVCTSCHNEYWTDCPNCGRIVRNEQLIGDGCVYCEKNRVTGGVVETTTEELVDDALQTLDINRPLSEKKVDDAYRKKVKEVHPDAGGSSEEFTDVTESKELLLKHISDE